MAVNVTKDLLCPVIISSSVLFLLSAELRIIHFDVLMSAMLDSFVENRNYRWGNPMNMPCSSFLPGIGRLEA